MSRYTFMTADGRQVSARGWFELNNIFDEIREDAIDCGFKWARSLTDPVRLLQAFDGGRDVVMLAVGNGRILTCVRNGVIRVK